MTAPDANLPAPPPPPASLSREQASYRVGLRAGLALVPPTLVLAISFGVLARNLDWGAAAPIVASVVVFSGSAQFAVASVLGAGGTVAAAVLAAVLVNARFAPMGLAVAPALRGGRLRRALEGQATIDTSWAMASRGDGSFDREMMLAATAPQFLAWVGGTAIGVVAGGVIGDPERWGLDALFPAFFLALLMAELRDRDRIAAAVLAAAVTLVLIPLTPPGVPVIAASAAALLGLRGR